jgi:hypothetical protein
MQRTAAPALLALLALLAARPVHAQAPMGGMGGMGGGGGMGGMGAGAPQPGKEKKEGPAEAAPKDKTALQPIEPVPAQPRGLRQLQLFELHGYMRMRTDYFHRMDLGLGKGNQSSIGGTYSDNSSADNKFFPPPAVANETVDGAGAPISQGGTDANCLGGLLDRGINASKAQRRCGRRNGFGSANMRLRMEPTLHITDTVKVHATIDALDNLVLGSTPDSMLGENPFAPIDLYTRTQMPPSDGRNSFSDSITVKRAYGHIRFGFGLDIKFGRMPHHWGMGIVANDGNGYYRGDRSDIVRMLDMDYGDSVDSLRLGFDFGKDRRSVHTLEASWDWASSGPTTSQLLGPSWSSGNRLGQDFSAERFDNVYQWRLSILRRDEPAMLQRKLSLGRPVVNYGAIVWIRSQAVDRVTGSPGIGDGLGTNPKWSDGDGNNDDGVGRRGEALGNGDLDDLGDSGIQNYANLLMRRRALVLTPDVWLRINWKTLRIELEGAGVIGRFYERDLSEDVNQAGFEYQNIGQTDITRRRFMQLGYALEFKYGLFKDRFHLGLDHGFASGDPSGSPYFNPQNPLIQGNDGSWTNFRFNPAYIQDLLLFRELLGTASNAAYFKPWLAFYFFENNFSGRLDIEYAVAQQRTATWGDKSNYGLELDLAFRYHDQQEPIFFQLQYGVMFPFGAFNRSTGKYDPTTIQNNGDAKAAQTIQAQLGIRF